MKRLESGSGYGMPSDNNYPKEVFPITCHFQWSTVVQSTQSKPLSSFSSWSQSCRGQTAGAALWHLGTASLDGNTLCFRKSRPS
jgi:hypothetical protein